MNCTLRHVDLATYQTASKDSRDSKVTTGKYRSIYSDNAIHILICRGGVGAGGGGGQGSGEGSGGIYSLSKYTAV